MRREWSLEAATQALVELRPLIVLLREQRASLETLKQQLLVLRRLERAGARPGGSDQTALQAAGSHQAPPTPSLTHPPDAAPPPPPLEPFPAGG